MRRNPFRLLTALLLALALVAGACGGDDGDDSTATTVAEEEVPEGGELVIGAEQEPDCVDFISSCAGSSWGHWMMNVTTLPRAYISVKDGDDYVYEPSDLLVGEAALEESPKQKITYKINPDAKWSDGTPITSTDFEYTWDQIVNGEDIYDTTGYSSIESVDASKPDTVVVTLSEPYANWKALFGGNYNVLPSHLLKGKDRSAEMANGFTFSGGPWKIDHWTKGTEAVLVPNENYWGDKPKLEKVTFKFVTDTAAEFAAFKGGEVSVIYPQPQLDVVDQIKSGLEGAKSSANAQTGNIEGLWFHNQKAPFDNIDFRKAVAYAIDRDAVVKRLFGDLGVEEPMNTLNAPIASKFADTDAFAEYKLDPAKVEEHMKKAGYTKGSDGLWAKGGQKASFTIKSTTGNKRRELTEQVIQQQLKDAGFDMQISNQAAGDLFGDQLPKGDYQVALYAQVLTTPDPALCDIMCSENIPSEANKFSGQNWQRIDIDDLDENLLKVKESLDEDERIEASQAADAITAENMVALPLDPLPNILLWKESVVGNIGDNAVMGPFFTMHQWGLAA